MRRFAVLALALGLPLLAPSAGWAAGKDLVNRDPACTRTVTVQYLDCEVAVIFSCPGVAGLNGPTLREEAYDEDGFAHFEVDTANGGMLVTGDADGSYVIRADRAGLKETPISKVLATGKGHFSSKATLTMYGATKSAGQKISIEKSGDPLTLNGVEMLPFKTEVRLDLPQPLGRSTSQGISYLLPSLGLYLTGEETGGTFFKPEDTPHRPMLLSLPGAPGFDTFKPVYCGSSLSSAAPILPDLTGVPA